jgi:hypothetical protein
MNINEVSQFIYLFFNIYFLILHWYGIGDVSRYQSIVYVLDTDTQLGAISAEKAQQLSAPSIDRQLITTIEDYQFPKGQDSLNILHRPDETET